MAARSFWKYRHRHHQDLTFTIKQYRHRGTNRSRRHQGREPSAADFTSPRIRHRPCPDPLAVTTFTLRFTPNTAGSKAAAIHIACNDDDEASFDINLTAQHFTPAPEIDVQQPAGTDLFRWQRQDQLRHGDGRQDRNAQKLHDQKHRHRQPNRIWSHHRRHPPEGFRRSPLPAKNRWLPAHPPPSRSVSNPPPREPAAPSSTSRTTMPTRIPYDIKLTGAGWLIRAFPVRTNGSNRPG